MFPMKEVPSLSRFNFGNTTTPLHTTQFLMQTNLFPLPLPFAFCLLLLALCALPSALDQMNSNFKILVRGV
jgi:hypothetical protein